jgi:hypothetical protein
MLESVSVPSLGTAHVPDETATVHLRVVVVPLDGVVHDCARSEAGASAAVAANAISAVGLMAAEPS